MSDIIVGVIALLLAGYTLIIYIRILIWRVKLIKTGGRTSATVTGMFKSVEPRIGTFHCPKLTYTAYEKHHTVEYNFGSWHGRNI